MPGRPSLYPASNEYSWLGHGEHWNCSIEYAMLHTADQPSNSVTADMLPKLPLFMSSNREPVGQVNLVLPLVVTSPHWKHVTCPASAMASAAHKHTQHQPQA